jgi:type IV secretory pathway TrbL component
MFFSHKESLNPHQQTHQLPLPLERRARTLYKGMYVVFMYIHVFSMYTCMYLCMYPPLLFLHWISFFVVDCKLRLLSTLSLLTISLSNFFKYVPGLRRGTVPL